MVLKMLYILPMILGRTFDARNDHIGIDIFSSETLATQQVQSADISKTYYAIVRNSETVQKLLDVSGDLSIKMKSGKLDIKGAGTYLKHMSSNDHTVEILTRATFYTSTIYLPFNITPVHDWLSHSTENLGTHYVRSITYGGELIASLKFVAHKAEDLQNIDATITTGIKGQKLNELLASGKLAQIKKDLEDKANMEISYFATVPLKSVPNTLEGLQSLIEGFEDQVKVVNKGLGVPVRVEMIELSNFDKRITFLKNSAIDNGLRKLEDNFDDLRKTKTVAKEWILELPPTITPKQESKISHFLKRLNSVLRTFHDTIGNLNVEIGIAQFQKASKAYREGGSGVPGKFYREFEKLKNELKISEPEDTDIGQTTYIRWGKDDCNTSTSTEIYNGYVTSGIEMGVGGGTNYICLSRDSNLGAIQTVDNRQASFLGGVKYEITETKVFENQPSLFGGGVVCSRCHTGNRSTVNTLAGLDDCPVGWIMEYSGFLAANKDSGHRSHYICLDKNPEHFKTTGSLNVDQNLVLVGVSNEDEGGNSIVNCAVCSK